MRTRTFGLLNCVGCAHFSPRRLHPEPSVLGPPAFVGFCSAEVEVVGLLWPGLEAAVARAGACPDRERVADEPPHCGWFEATAESTAGAYPYSCVHYRSGVCGLPTGGSAGA